jgi:hypothetical protein
VGDFAIAQVRFAQDFRAVLQGQVVDDTTGDPILGARIEAVGDVTRSRLTDAMGIYRLPVPPGTYNVMASAFGYLSQTVKGVDVTDVTTLDFALMSAPPHMVSGTVTTPDGAPAAGAEVRILSTPIPPTRTEDQGNYVFVNVPEGTYMIQASGGCFVGSHTRSVVLTDDVVVDFGIPRRRDTFGYTCSEANPFDWIPGDTLSPLVGDDVTLTVPLGFAFNYYGADFTNVTLSTNINAHFGLPNPSFSHQCPAFPGAPIAGLVGLAFDDGFVGPPGSGNIYTMMGRSRFPLLPR